MLFQLFKMNLRTLICAPTNVAITEVASRVLKLLTGYEDDSFCSCGDLLFFGNKERLKVGSDNKNIFPDCRVNRLTECLGPRTGWKHCLNSMISLLEDCVSQYNVFVENELIKSKENNDEDEVQKLEYKSFLEFLRDRFRCTASPLQRCLLIFCSHLPRKFVGENTFHDTVTLGHSLDSLEKLLFQDNVVSEELEKLLLHPENVEGSSVFSLLLCLRSKSLSVLRSLRLPLEELHLPRAMNSKSIMEFCFQRASLIFCTVSSSYKLHSVEMQPPKLLVIDEATQLKECESCIPLQLLGMRHAILIGDECQLPATVRSSVSDEAGFGRCLFERLSRLGQKASESSILDKSKLITRKLNVSKSDKGKANLLPNVVASKTQIVSSNQETGGNKGKGNSKSKKSKKGKRGPKNK